MMNPDQSKTPDSAEGSVPAVVLGGFGLINETLMRGKDWAYNERVQAGWRMWDPWPDGCLLHVSGPTPDGGLTQAVWRDEAAEFAYMSTIAIERFTGVIAEMVKEGFEPPADVLPVNLELKYLAFGPLAERFVDIGADLDGAAGRQFGTVLTAVDLGLTALSGEQLEELWRTVGLGESVPADLIMRAAFVKDGESIETQIWASDEAAQRFVEAALKPAVTKIAGSGDAVSATFREIKRLAIAPTGLVDP